MIKISFLLFALVGLTSVGRCETPLMRDFMGINGHYPFKPELYRPLVHKARNYHSINWDVKKPGDPPTFPICANRVNWDQVYGPWVKSGMEVDACVMFGTFGPGKPGFPEMWKNQSEWIEKYGRQFAEYFGPHQGNALVHAMEIGNEPGKNFPDTLYRELFKAMASGIRAGDPEMKILTCTVHVGEADAYHKSVEETFGDPALWPLFDVLNVHTYASLPAPEGSHPWARTYPEDPRSPFLKKVDDMIAWRDKHVPDKKIWITEFGWDACTEEAMSRREGWAKKLNWSGVTEAQQANYLVRALLLFASRPVDRAYIYFYDDSDEPSVHASSGLTRNQQPKRSYWAIRHLQKILGEYAFERILSAKDSGHMFAFRSKSGEEIRVVWKATGEAVTLSATNVWPEAKHWQLLSHDPEFPPIESAEKPFVLSERPVFLF